MFDIAYENEAIINAAELVKDSIFKRMDKLNLYETEQCFYECLEICRMNNYIIYYSIMYYTHGV